LNSSGYGGKSKAYSLIILEGGRHPISGFKEGPPISGLKDFYGKKETKSVSL